MFGRISRFAREPRFLGPKEVVLTFDDGPSPAITRSILKTLASYCAKATFFPVGRMAVAYPSLMREISRAGHTIGAHTWTHPNNLRRIGPTTREFQIEKGFAAIAKATNAAISPFFRFPGLNDDKHALAYLQARGVATFSVDVVTDDSFISDAKELENITLKRIFEHQGGIVLFHDIKPATAEALPHILSGLASKGYSIVHMTSKFSFTPLDRFAKEMSQRLANAEEPVAKVSLAGLQRTLRPSNSPPPVPPPVTLLSPERRKIELATARAQRIRSLVRSFKGSGWSRIVEQKPDETVTAQ
ncbi:MAG: polysaccharide deacetylase family protein [Hyphomicrobiaceae bacterium]